MLDRHTLAHRPILDGASGAWGRSPHVYRRTGAGKRICRPANRSGCGAGGAGSIVESGEPSRIRMERALRSRRTHGWFTFRVAGDANDASRAAHQATRRPHQRFMRHRFQPPLLIALLVTLLAAWPAALDVRGRGLVPGPADAPRLALEHETPLALRPGAAADIFQAARGGADPPRRGGSAPEASHVTSVGDRPTARQTVGPAAHASPVLPRPRRWQRPPSRGPPLSV